MTKIFTPILRVLLHICFLLFNSGMALLNYKKIMSYFEINKNEINYQHALELLLNKVLGMLTLLIYIEKKDED